MQRQALLRKSNDASRGKGAAPAQSTGSAMERGLPLIFARAAEDCFALPLLVTALSSKPLRIEDIQQALPDTGLYMLLEGPNGATGALTVDLATVCAVLEHLTMGRVLGRAPDATRAPTAVDAALVSSVFDALLQASDDTFAQNGVSDWPADHRFGSRVEDARTLMLSLAEKGFTVFDITLSLGAANVAGNAQLILPNAEIAQKDEHSAEALAAKAAVFRENVMLAPAELTAVLHRITVTLDQLGALKVGDTLEIPLSALQNCTLEMQMNETMAQAALGQINGLRAVRLALPNQDAPAAQPADRPATAGAQPTEMSPLPVVQSPQDGANPAPKHTPKPIAADPAKTGQTAADRDAHKNEKPAQQNHADPMSDIPEIEDLDKLTDLS